MTQKEALRTVIKNRNHTYLSLSEKLGWKQSTVSDKVNRYDIRLSTLLELAESLDYEVVLRSKLTDKNEVVITESNK